MVGSLSGDISQILLIDWIRTMHGFGCHFFSIKGVFFCLRLIVRRTISINRICWRQTAFLELIKVLRKLFLNLYPMRIQPASRKDTLGKL